MFQLINAGNQQTIFIIMRAFPGRKLYLVTNAYKQNKDSNVRHTVKLLCKF